MTVKLPISIYVCDDLKQQFVKITSTCNKLEAQLNFQTMTANWYGDEDSILLVQLHLATSQGFVEQQKLMQQIETQTYSDDVFSYYQDNEEQTLICHIALTDSELLLLNQQNKLLVSLLQVKLQKVLNLVAQQLKLNII
ncbi:MAG: hypothetical protein COB83_13595 [Gammaproteobacteria bacterium]|nr:MAG: hypothetical protein COB83_13595 [Gammaproteobacteria bacterium]